MQSAYRTINRLIEAVLVFLFSLLVLDVLWQVFSRKVLDKSFSFTEEFARYALIWLAVLGAAYLNGQREHLSMDFLTRRLPPPAFRRRMRTLEIIMALFALVVLVIGGGNLVYTTLYLGQTSPAMHLPLGLVYLIVPLSGLLIIFYSIYNIREVYASRASADEGPAIYGEASEL